MPRTHRTTRPAAGLAPVSVAILLPPPGGRHQPAPASRPGGLSPHGACQILTWYTRHGDLVTDLDATPAVAAAARWLERRRLAVTDHGWATAAAPPPGPSPRRRARLVIATLPRPGARRLAGITEWMRHVRARLLAPGGYLLTVVAAGTNGRFTDNASNVVAAAKAAGLAYQQQLIDIPQPLWPEHEPRAEPATAAATAPRLVRGRHLPVHREVYAFHTGGQDA